MTLAKPHVGLLFGGLSSEHDVSLTSARTVLEALDPERYRVTLIRIDRAGRWHVEPSPRALLSGAPDTDPDARPALFSPADPEGEVRLSETDGGGLAALDLDVVFPMLHGQNGEDGAVQGFLKTLGVAYVGPDVLGSAVCMDKEVTKRLLRDAGIAITPFLVVRRAAAPPAFEAVVEALGLPFFVKPANSGSSVGVTRVEAAEGYGPALDLAFQYDRKVLLERGIVGREIEVAVLGNEAPEASVPGEVVSTAQFYTYDAKYTDPDASRMEVPADLPAEVAERVRQLAVEAALALGCEGMARVDFFVTEGGDVLVNEVNTIPGFTSRSMYPVMWAEAGLPIGALVDRLIALAVERHARDGAVKTTR